MRAIQADLFREMSASIERYEGFAEKFVGDAVMAVFGAPAALEDHAERALHAQGVRTFVLDGDNVRHGLNKDLGFTAEDRAAKPGSDRTTRR